MVAVYSETVSDGREFVDSAALQPRTGNCIKLEDYREGDLLLYPPAPVATSQS